LFHGLPVPFQWILMGPARSGTGVHVDPLGTHAWVTVTQGCKLWILFAPHEYEQLQQVMDCSLPSALWFAAWAQLEEQPPHVACLHQPGETVYVPAGWPHVVLNLEDSVAVTHNYASVHPSPQALVQAVKEQEPELLEEVERRLADAGS